MTLTRHRERVLLVGALSIGLLAYSTTVHLLPGYNVVYVPLSIAVATVLYRVASRAGMNHADLGLERSTARAGVTAGVLVALVAATVLALAVVTPVLHPLFGDNRVAGMSAGLLAYRAAIRIPLGTALLEELAFRGVLLGAWTRIGGQLQAAIGSSIVFGLWHVRPTIELLDANGLAPIGATRLGLVFAAVAATACAGLLFSWLRIRSGSLLAPYIAHAGVNSLALLGAFVVG